MQGNPKGVRPLMRTSRCCSRRSRSVRPLELSQVSIAASRAATRDVELPDVSKLSPLSSRGGQERQAKVPSPQRAGSGWRRTRESFSSTHKSRVPTRACTSFLWRRCRPRRPGRRVGPLGLENVGMSRGGSSRRVSFGLHHMTHSIESALPQCPRI